MSTLLRNLLGNAPEAVDTAGEMRAVLYDLRQERGHCEALVNSARATVTRFQEMSEPLSRAGDNMNAISGRLTTLEQRLAGFERFASQLQGLDEGAERLAQRQRQADARLARSEEVAQKLESLLAEMADRVDTALELREQLDSFLSMETPFRRLQGDADALRGEVGGATERLARIREQHERVMEEHSVAHAKLGAFDRRHDELARSVDEKEQRIAGMEHALSTLHEVQQLADDAKQRLGTLKVLGDYVAAKTSALEAQRDSVERALARADALDEAVRQIDAGLRRQQENARSLVELQEQADGLQALSGEVLAKASGMEQLRDEASAQLAAVRAEVAEATAEAKRSAEQFAFESRGIEAVTQRITDLRGTVSDLESRFASVNESRQSAAELQSQLASATSRVETLAAEIGRLDAESERVQGLRRDLDVATQVATQAADRLAGLEDAQPAMEAALRDLEQLRGVHALVTDTLERAQHAGAELARLREEQTGTRTWLADVEATVTEVGKRVAELRKFTPGIEFVQGQVKRINESLSGIESRREVIEDMQRRMAELTALGGTLDERGRELQTRMDGAEQRFVTLAAHADEAERLGATVAGLTMSLQEAENDVREVGRNVVALQARCESIETLVERTRVLRHEIEQRQHALEEASQQLQQASELRQQAASSAQALDERAKQLAAALAAAERQADRVGAVSQQLEERADGLRFVDRRLGEFEERLARWELVDQEVARSLEQIAARQATVETLQADMDRMAGVAEKTAENVRTITAAQREIDESRVLVDDLLAMLSEARHASGALEERRRQLGQAEARLARADALLIDVRSGIQVLQSQKVVVDQAIEKAGSLEFLLRQADASIRTLRDERDMSTRLKAAMAAVVVEEEDEESMEARA
jgi:chromosome segregation ATPase